VPNRKNYIAEDSIEQEFRTVMREAANEVARLGADLACACIMIANDADLKMRRARLGPGQNEEKNKTVNPDKQRL
jgi:hypothetical protein